MPEQPQHTNPDQKTEPAASPAWEFRGNDIWMLPLNDGTVLYTSRNTPEDRARFAEAWVKPDDPTTMNHTIGTWTQQDNGSWTLSMTVGHRCQAAFHTDASSTQQQRAQFADIAKAVSPILEECPEHNRIDEHEHVVAEITRAVLAVLQQSTPASETENAK